MEPIAGNRKHDIDHAYMYYVKDIPWLPHYDKKDVYVAPGGMEKTVEELKKLGGVKTQTVLWPRH